jgi:hypothetical protein
MIAVYVSSRCSNCVRLLSSIKRIPSLQGARIIDIDHADKRSIQQIEYVPTLVDDSGRTHVGTAAFEFIKQYQSEIEYEPMQIGGGLSFGSIDGGGELNWSSFGGDL